ncbi:MAG: ABC transporter ATP-binding protein [Candidatus Dormibacteria bacterium]
MLELRDIRAGYGDTPVLRGVSLVVPPRSVVALLGANGAGKTTLLRTASGLITPRSGRILLDGEELTGRAAYRFARAGICHVPEGRGIFPSLTVRENIVLQANAGRAEEAIERAASAFPILGERLGQVAGTLSGGEQQMLALARAYVREPRVVLLDEVSMGLAPLVVDEIYSFLRRLASQGVALLIVEQYVVRAMEVADHVFLLTRGAVSFAGEPGELETAALFERYMGAGSAPRSR